MKTNAIVRIVLFSLAILVLLGILLVGLFSRQILSQWDWGNLIFHLGDDSIVGGTVESSFTVDSSIVKHISIEWASGSVLIQPGNSGDNTIYVAEEGATTNNIMVWKQSGDTLKIQFCETTVYFGLSFERNKNLTITVPPNWVCDELEIDAASADVRISDLVIHEIDFDGASGDCRFENCHVGELDLDTASGDIAFSGTLNTLSCDAASADVTAVLSNVPKSIDMDMASGDLDLTLPENSGFTVSLDALSGRFSSDFATTNQNGRYVYGDGSCRIDVSAMSGNVSIRKAPYIPVVAEIYAVLCADSFTMEQILSPLESHYPADTLVTIQTNVLMDADLALYVNGEFMCKQTEAFAPDGSNYWTFTFRMPKKDAVIQFKTSGGM